MNFTEKNQDLYRGLNPNSRVFMSFHHGEWKLGDAIYGLDGTVHEMLFKAKQTLEQALNEW
ncbi:hypothetical protein [Vibrio harveyi]|uniref:hypothetical protein n=1 Tax=Vibrio harveyi TaxID=669 RepID=UPI003BB76644|nr:hypothetical protein [Vibrio harveyi]